MAGKKRRSGSQHGQNPHPQQPKQQGSLHLKGVTMLATNAARTSEAVDSLDTLRMLRDALVAWEVDVVTEARAQGASWEAIGQAMGLRRQAVWLRYGKPS